MAIIIIIIAANTLTIFFKILLGEASSLDTQLVVLQRFIFGRYLFSYSTITLIHSPRPYQKYSYSPWPNANVTRLYIRSRILYILRTLCVNSPSRKNPLLENLRFLRFSFPLFPVADFTISPLNLFLPNPLLTYDHYHLKVNYR